ncbi:hypothetical protein BDY17DRAFT_326204 [Neohortaea acidophila]|uniref:Uncharacterized protein n=1 Tax=Neohortaea acidophila TaxID=245834 RepID=A0A6A6PN40_9PEZI|nr:uncharacterized protein BDY17DRAFT_326204 [Neohortaea acidophila]KAF2481520.1 hypothetical protein BDY17DRAFT_326204 [Neohortaea acidophila]
MQEAGLLGVPASQLLPAQKQKLDSILMPPPRWTNRADSGLMPTSTDEEDDAEEEDDPPDEVPMKKYKGYSKSIRAFAMGTPGMEEGGPEDDEIELSPGLKKIIDGVLMPPPEWTRHEDSGLPEWKPRQTPASKQQGQKKIPMSAKAKKILDTLLMPPPKWTRHEDSGLPDRKPQQKSGSKKTHKTPSSITTTEGAGKKRKLKSQMEEDDEDYEPPWVEELEGPWVSAAKRLKLNNGSSSSFGFRSPGTQRQTSKKRNRVMDEDDNGLDEWAADLKKGKPKKTGSGKQVSGQSSLSGRRLETPPPTSRTRKAEFKDKFDHDSDEEFDDLDLELLGMLGTRHSKGKKRKLKETDLGNEESVQQPPTSKPRLSWSPTSTSPRELKGYISPPTTSPQAPEGYISATELQRNANARAPDPLDVDAITAEDFELDERLLDALLADLHGDDQQQEVNVNDGKIGEKVCDEDDGWNSDMDAPSVDDD